MPTALLSAFDKTGLEDFANELERFEFSILGSRGTAEHLQEKGVAVTDISEMVGEPILGHRVVTLSREIHAGLLARDEDEQELRLRGIRWIDLVYVDLYPIRIALQDPGRTLASVVEMTDIGGPAMLMAAVKGGRLVLCDRNDLRSITIDLRDGDWRSPALRRRYAAKATALVSSYYGALAEFLGEPQEGVAA
jgi:phosphoribosylaminoimidazolecarboxamide formyltransferase/IMP cyclohydrolase